MRSSTNLDLTDRCRRCLFHTAWCLCPAIVPTSTRLRVSLIQHVSETWKSSNSGRWASLALPAATVHPHGGIGDRVPSGAFREPETWVLFPGPVSTPRTTASGIRHLIVLDATWQQARRMIQRIDSIRTLPRLSLPEAPSIDRLRKPTVAAGMSTLEAIARALDHLGEPEPAQSLLELHNEAVRRARAIRGIPGVASPGAPGSRSDPG